MSGRFYQELSEWWTLFSPASHYVEEAQDLLRRLAPLPAPRTKTMLELGCGGGSLASHLKDHFLPDFVKETFETGTDDGGEDAPDGRGFRYLEWKWDPDPRDTTYIVDYAFLLREASGDVREGHDRHIEGLFPRATWLKAFAAAGLRATSELDAWGRDVFIAEKA